MARPVTAQDYGSLPARELVRLVQAAAFDNDDPEAQTVLTAFYHRYSGYVARVAANHSPEPHGDSAIDERIHDTFIGFFETCVRFDVDRGKSDEACEANLLAYLAQQAVWRCRNAVRATAKSNRVHILSDEALHHLQENASSRRVPEVNPAGTLSPDRIDLADAWIRSLNDRDADIIRAYFFDDHAGPFSDRLPSAEISRLTEKYGIKSSAIRKAKARLLDKFEALINSVHPSP